MKFTFSTVLAASLCRSLASTIPFTASTSNGLATRQTTCDNTATSRSCWGDYSIDTDWYTVTPDTGVTREFWLSAENVTAAPDGYQRYVLTFNGTVPGPAIIADWGDNLIIHVTNNLEVNGTSIHWHGIRQLNNTEYDGVPGVTQCPIAPGQTFTYKFQATQYGSTWYHSHLTQQYGDGLLGPLIINGPATADYDEDLGMLFLSDWSHTPASELWDSARQGAPPVLEGGLINGTNVFDCTGSTDPLCVGGSKKFETVFETGKKYRIRIINSAIEGHFQYSIDGHNLTVIGMDLVPLVPYTTDSVVISMGQRYDLIVEANAATNDYWMRAGWISACLNNDNPDNMTGIVRYDSTSTADPTTTSDVTIGSNCGDEPLASLVPYLAMNAGNYTELVEEDLSFTFGSYFTWTINSSSLYMNWSDPTIIRIFNNDTIWPTDYNVVPLTAATDDEWELFVIQDLSGIGLYHPIHMHGHDFWVVSQGVGTFDISDINLVNPPRRDVASLPANGYLAIAFKKDNPGAWLLHCHIAWHASQGLAMEFVERESEIAVSMTNTAISQDNCAAWVSYDATATWPQDDSGI
ncbi:laccase from botrytis Aclada At 1.67 A resolution [Mollisia scopiformis]|uniref:laccase n=1 Tax=Mollisia scopiformis TaxID=149040 RepID=A0A194XDV1_MOLSC|nr:laccase from botrytis Aclada At 1.67 A resolution [Mollisia scopiformis]KUJ18329.1 laccase from botrytis Aclada At 1.67 A resolution [Mollisia scopiformis]